MGAPSVTITTNTMPWPSPPQESHQPHDHISPEDSLPTSLVYKPPIISRALTAPHPHVSTHVNTHFPQSPVSATTARQIPSPVTTSLGSTCMQPTWRGFIHTTRDGLMLLEACLQGQLSHIPRRPHDRERQSIISSGNIFVYEENASGIRRWTDGITWSPSRIMGNFLVYRELRDGHQPGEKKRAAKKRKRGSEDLSSHDGGQGKSEEDRQLIGSLSLDAYNFKPGGLAKKTLSVEYRGVRHHIISYYRVDDVKSGMYGRPLQDDYLRNLEPRRELVENPGFKFPVEERDDKATSIPVSPTSQMPNSHGLHSRQMMSQSGYPVGLGLPHSSHMSHMNGVGQNNVSTRLANSMHIPMGSLDPFDIDTSSMHQVQSTASSQHTPISPHSSISTVNGQQGKPLAPNMRQIRPSSHSPIDRGVKRQRNGSQQIMYWDGNTSTATTPSHMPQGLDWSFATAASSATIPNYANKYVDDVSYHPSFVPHHQQQQHQHQHQHQHDFPHHSMYLMPQSQQSYSG